MRCELKIQCATGVPNAGSAGGARLALYSFEGVMPADLYFEDLNARHHSPLNQRLKTLQTLPAAP
jgi:hypothetical protein